LQDLKARFQAFHEWRARESRREGGSWPASPRRSLSRSGSGSGGDLELLTESSASFSNLAELIPSLTPRLPGGRRPTKEDLNVKTCEEWLRFNIGIRETQAALGQEATTMPDDAKGFSSPTVVMHCGVVASVLCCTVGIATWCSPRERLSRKEDGRRRSCCTAGHVNAEHGEIGRQHFLWVNPDIPAPAPVTPRVVETPPPRQASASEFGLFATETPEPLKEAAPAFASLAPTPTSTTAEATKTISFAGEAVSVAYTVSKSWSQGGASVRPSSLPSPREHITSDDGLVRTTLKKEIFGKAYKAT
jgi:hypothetical protein